MGVRILSVFGEHTNAVIYGTDVKGDAVIMTVPRKVDVSNIAKWFSSKDNGPSASILMVSPSSPEECE